MDRNLYCVLDEDYSLCKTKNKRIAIIVYLYYEEDLENYLDRLLNVPKDIPIYIISSVVNVVKIARLFFERQKRNKVEYIYKENRGRDVSALLISSKKIFEDYEYVCFLHDKKAKNKTQNEDISLWIENLWTNMIATQEYIQNVINKLEVNTNIGMLVPPAPIGVVYTPWYKNGWNLNFGNTKKLAEELELACEIKYEDSPISYGTVFWCRTKSLKKLFAKEWKYEDFEEEPLPGDGTISHAIERILSYVVMDEGYTTEVIMTKKYAVLQTSFIQKQMTKTYDLLEKMAGIKSYWQVLNIEKNLKNVFEFIQTYKKIYIYGAGDIGRICIEFLKMKNVEPIAFIVSKHVKNEQSVENVSVIELADLKYDDDCGILIAVTTEYQSDILKNLQDYGYKNVCLFYGD